MRVEAGSVAEPDGLGRVVVVSLCCQLVQCCVVGVGEHVCVSEADVAALSCLPQLAAARRRAVGEGLFPAGPVEVAQEFGVRVADRLASDALRSAARVLLRLRRASPSC